jgi:hypothetical protein
MSGVGLAEQAEPILNLLFPYALWKYIPGGGGEGGGVHISYIWADY